MDSDQLTPVLGPSEPYRHLADFLNKASRVTCLRRGVRRRPAEVIELARKLKAPIVHASRQGVCRKRQPLRVGMTGWRLASGYAA